MTLLTLGPLPEFLQAELDRELDQLLGVAGWEEEPDPEPWRTSDADLPADEETEPAVSQHTVPVA